MPRHQNAIIASRKSSDFAVRTPIRTRTPTLRSGPPPQYASLSRVPAPAQGESDIRRRRPRRKRQFKEPQLEPIWGAPPFVLPICSEAPEESVCGGPDLGLKSDRRTKMSTHDEFNVVRPFVRCRIPPTSFLVVMVSRYTLLFLGSPSLLTLSYGIWESVLHRSPQGIRSELSCISLDLCSRGLYREQK